MMVVQVSHMTLPVVAGLCYIGRIEESESRQIDDYGTDRYASFQNAAYILLYFKYSLNLNI